MPTGKYANAKDVLPEELLKEVRKYFTGTLYVEDENNSAKRRQMVLTLFEAEMPTKEIAKIVGICRERVNQIVADKRRQWRAEFRRFSADNR